MSDLENTGLAYCSLAKDAKSLLAFGEICLILTSSITTKAIKISRLILTSTYLTVESVVDGNKFLEGRKKGAWFTAKLGSKTIGMCSNWVSLAQQLCELSFGRFDRAWYLFTHLPRYAVTTLGLVPLSRSFYRHMQENQKGKAAADGMGVVKDTLRMLAVGLKAAEVCEPIQPYACLTRRSLGLARRIVKRFNEGAEANSFAH